MRNRLRVSWLGVVLAVTIIFAGCYPFQGDISLLLTPVPIDPTRQAEIQAALADARAQAAVTQESMAGEAAMGTVTATVSTNSLRVRQDADVESPIVAGLRQNDTVQVVGQTGDGIWLQIQIPDVETLGWVSAEFVTVEGDVMTLPVPGAEMAEQPAASEATAPTPSPEAVIPTPSPAAVVPTPTPEATALPVEEMAMEVSALTLNGDAAALQIVDGVLTIPSITSSSDGWLVVHADDGGTFGAVIGYAPIVAGDNLDVAISIDSEAATETVHLMLHADAGVVGTYEFPGVDAPVLVDGAPVSMAHAVGKPVMTTPAAGSETATPAAGSEIAAPTTAPTTAPTAAPTAASTTAPTTGSETATPAAGGETPTPAAGGETTAPAESASGGAMPASEAAAMTGMTSTELATVNTRSLRVRNGPSADATIVGGVLNGDVFPVAETSPDGMWMRVYFPGIDGEAWIDSEFVDVSAVELNVKFGNVVVSTGGARLRVRSAPSLESSIVDHVYNGDVRYAIGVSKDGKWALLFLSGVAGPTWVSTDYIVYQ